LFTVAIFSVLFGSDNKFQTGEGEEEEEEKE
jgi:hypothetical protein